MATAMASCDFEGWLSDKLEKLNIDHEVFGSYILGIMESEDSTEEDKTEALTDILSEISGSVEDVCQEIFQHWNKTSQDKQEQENHAKLQNKEDSAAKMASIMEKHATTQEVKKEFTTEDKERKAALVAKYGNVSESDEERYPFEWRCFYMLISLYHQNFGGRDSTKSDEGGDKSIKTALEDEVKAKGQDNAGEAVNKTPKTSNNIDEFINLLAPNTNAASVVKQQQEQREKNKQAHVKRREMEKEQREQQQQKSQDRKDKEQKRTQKQERKR
ncbi:uncharacterized protein [Amphiura filiformis]|uniref:uncharacterized protein n=1 Tax=Amphiura filiformis TaxID=82378 RepID=UPI003B21159B